MLGRRHLFVLVRPPGRGANGWDAADVDLSPSKTRLVSSL